MSTVIVPGEVATRAAGKRSEAPTARLTTTLYDLIAALQDVVGAEDDMFVVITVVHLLQSGRLTWLRTNEALRGERPTAHWVRL
jgi:hypothetical protein